MTIEPLSDWAQTQSRNLIIHRLMHRRMNHKAVQSTVKLHIRRMFQIGRMIGIRPPFTTWSRQRLTSYEILSVNMRHRSRLADICLRHRFICCRTVMRYPSSSHWHIRLRLHIHAIHQINTSVFLALGIASHATFLQDVRQLIIQIIRYQVAQSLSPIAQELLTLFRTTYYLSRQYWKPRQQCIATTRLKLLHHQRCPVLLSRLITICHDVFDHAAQLIFRGILIHS